MKWGTEKRRKKEKGGRKGTGKENVGRNLSRHRAREQQGKKEGGGGEKKGGKEWRTEERER